MNKAEFTKAKQFIFNDIYREIELARAPNGSLAAAGVRPGGGNFLAALGLLCYTEFGGKLKYKHRKASRNFNDFYDDLGPEYKTFRAKHNVYDIFRCGLAHEYYVKKSCTIAMLGIKNPSGIISLSNGRYAFIVEKYCDDLFNAFNMLEALLFP